MQKKLILILWLAIVVSFLVFSLKYTAYYLTNSTALYADAIESLVNIFTSIMSLYAIYISFKPADSNHIYGHYKVEYLFAIVEGILILGIAILIFYHSYNNIISYANGKKLILHNISWGLIFNFIALVVNLILTK
ncbi:cation diffusion facilitator family transporter [Bartonella sp. DGB1]|uniref:cation diffusion facilitator family transporter n=1 Tax=Bartonella sp. DGB1 TaxID=3239807 RepID=UPI0035266F58